MRVPPMIENKVNHSIKGAIIDLLKKEYQFIAGEKIQEMFAQDILKVMDRCWKDPWRMEVGQVLWYGAKKEEKPHYGRGSKNTSLTPVVLTLISSEDLERKQQGYSDREIKEKKMARLFREAFEQGALLTHSDLAFLLHLSTGTVSKQVREYMEKTGEILPSRGIVHDIGRAVTHKKIIIRLYREGYQTPEIARKTSHSEEACDRYIKAYRKVLTLSKKLKPEEISRTLEMSLSLVREYLELSNEKEGE
ncbi:MAG: DUF1670 domain-containing protein [Acidobacteriota bacterium]